MAARRAASVTAAKISNNINKRKRQHLASINENGILKAYALIIVSVKTLAASISIKKRSEKYL